MKMNPLRPYLVKALMAWIEDNGMTPYLVANAEVPGVQVPPGIVHEGRVLFNISSNAISNFMIDDETLSFSARFSNRAFTVVLPLNSLEVVFSKEKGHEREAETIELESFIAVKGIKAQGNQLTVHKVKQIKTLDPLPYEVVEEEEEKEEGTQDTQQSLFEE